MQQKHLYDEGHARKGESKLPSTGRGAAVTKIMSPSEIGFAFLIFDPVDLFPLSKIRIVQFLFERSRSRKEQSVSDDDDGGDVTRR